MNIVVVDRSATSGHSALHRAAPVAKLSAFALVLAAVIITNNVLVLAGLVLCLTGIAVRFRLPVRTVLAFAAYPGIFAAAFAFAASAGMIQGTTIVLKAIAAALVAVLLMFTTPYPQVFAPLQRIMPGLLGDVMLMTYRSLFLLADAFSNTLRTARLRAGIVGAQPIRSARVVTRTLGSVLLYSMDLSQRTYDVMRLRGYEGRLMVSRQPSVSRRLDAAVVVLALVILSVAAAWRLGWRYLNPYSWLPALLGALMLVVGVIIINIKKES